MQDERGVLDEVFMCVYDCCPESIYVDTHGEDAF